MYDIRRVVGAVSAPRLLSFRFVFLRSVPVGRRGRVRVCADRCEPDWSGKFRIGTRCRRGPCWLFPRPCGTPFTSARRRPGRRGAPRRRASCRGGTTLGRVRTSSVRVSWHVHWDQLRSPACEDQILQYTVHSHLVGQDRPKSCTHIPLFTSKRKM